MAFAALQSGDGPMSENAPSPLSGSVASLAAHQPGRPISALVISGGSAANSVLDAFTGLFDNVSFVLPVSDNGGSSSEIIRVLGGPSIGDIRSRLVRLIPDSHAYDGIKALFAYRLPSESHISNEAIKQEWLSIVEGSHSLWHDIPADRREAIRAFLVHFEHAILRRAQRRFNFRSGSIGNFWLAGAQLFVRSLQSAIFLFSSVCGISPSYSVIPSINTNSLVTIAAELGDGTHIVGQNEISHPSQQSAVADMMSGAYTPSLTSSSTPRDASARVAHTPTSYVGAAAHQSAVLSRPESRISNYGVGTTSESPFTHGRSHLRESSVDDDSLGVLARTQLELDDGHDIDDNDAGQEHDPGDVQWDTPRRDSSPSGNIIFTKPEDGSFVPLPSPISRIFYLNTYGQETYPAPASVFLNSLVKCEVLVYSCGSLYTSLIPPLVLSGVGNTIAMSTRLKQKILLLNGNPDRETEGMTALDFVHAITMHLNGSIRQASKTVHDPHHLAPLARRQLTFSPGDYITHIVYLEAGRLHVDVEALGSLHIQCVPVSQTAGSAFTDTSIREALSSILTGS